ncbi:DUF2795 domain-containing protein [Lentzea sp. NBRC 102530]|uniref:DUF2795 domain-containing protein n=1 Tax=Lentzea sp. NBRC 102530 TaxID=3032201 RepID=UPI0024A27627|nr:DUF2795 domain-containing protein [Lentzea sp. NBRC 102530]GLY49883.1 hypothetical protein Lesp01_35390 [Lentzea sp. NBRC 102530]
MGVKEKIVDALNDVDFPAGKEQLVEHAENKEAGEDVLRALRGLPPADYENENEVVRSVRIDPAEGRPESERAVQAREARKHHTHLAEHEVDG